MLLEHKSGLDESKRGDAPAAAIRSWDQRLVGRVMARLGDPPLKLVLPAGHVLYAPSSPPMATVHLQDRAALLRMLLDPYSYFGDAYAAGRIDVHGGLVELLEQVYRTGRLVPDGRWLRRNRNTLAGSRDNIHRHYDLGNAFYRLWLDSEMLYTCAYFERESMTLEEAQIAKMDHVCRKLRLGPSDRVVEAGCGWGSLALHMARRFGAKVRAFNISREQIAFARERAKREGLSERVEFIEDDYRHVTGRYDAFMSVGMLEHVGVENYRELGRVIDRCLTPTGRGLIHTIGRHRPMAFNRWMADHIFPGAHIPSLSQMMEVFEPQDFSVLDVENLRLHYAQTLRHWLVRFEAVADRVTDMFDDKFVRIWRLYLAGSMAAFTTGWTQLYQVVFNRHTSNDVPWTRAGLYRRAEGGDG